MGNIYGSVREDGLTSAEGAAYQLKNRHTREQTIHQLTLERVSTATGTIPVKFIPRGGTVAEVLYAADGTTARSIDISAPQTIVFEGFIEAVVLDLTGLTGACNAILESR